MEDYGMCCNEDQAKACIKEHELRMKAEKEYEKGFVYGILATIGIFILIHLVIIIL